MDLDDAKLLRAQLVGIEREYTVYKTYEKDPSGPSPGDPRSRSIAVSPSANRRDGGRLPRRTLPLRGRRSLSGSQRSRIHLGGQRAGTPSGPPLRRDRSRAACRGSEFPWWAVNGCGEGAVSADRFAAFVKARDATLAAMEQTKAYIEEHAASWPENYAIGRAAYDAMLRDEKLLPFNSDDIERIGRDELAHGWPYRAG